MIKQSGGQMRGYQGAHTFVQQSGAWFHRQSHVVALLQGMMTVNTTVHDKRATLWQKGAGNGQLRATVRADMK